MQGLKPSTLGTPMSALGQKETFAVQYVMSALPPTATPKRILGNGHVRVLIRRCRIKAAFNTSSDKGLELRVRHTLRNWGDSGLELSRYQRSNQAHRTLNGSARRST